MRTARSQVLATVAAGSNALEAWQREERGSADLVVMRARVAVERALRASRQHGSWSEVLANEARAVCWEAAAPADPVPRVCLLALAQLDQWSALPEHQVAPPAGSMIPRGRDWADYLATRRADL
ncbi:MULTISPECIES: hypothetical protein [unclassified Kitasatospora]|uniref:hypothetical protein n=1 Tax=unclassified Kitasatospora TaxID=2633591 RepID=UPI0024751A2D|nr:hypothetical protein [Kitasatospora sp. MAP12-44]